MSEDCSDADPTRPADSRLLVLRFPQAQADAHVYVPALRVDPESRAALLTLPGDAIAVLPIVSGHIADFEEELIGKARK